MKHSFLFVNIIFLILISTNLFSQVERLSDADLQQFKKQAYRKVRSFEYNIRQIINDENNRNIWIEETIRLFAPGATIEVAGKKSGVSSPISISLYISRTVPNYAKNNGLVVFEFIAIQVGDFIEKKKINGKIYYEAEIKFKQRFCRSSKRYNNSNEIVDFDYCDTTDKVGVIFLEQKTNRKGNYWQLLLGNISVESITD